MLTAQKTFRIYLGVLRGSAVVSDEEIIAALNAFGDLPMANAMLADGGEGIQAAAERWGREHGYTVHEVQPWEQAP